MPCMLHTEFPITPSIRVAVNGELVPRSRTNGWDYNADANAIVFFRSINQGDNITVGYKTWLPIGG